MKKLCTYLTLFVLGLLALAQPVVAADLVKGQKYYIDASGFTGSLGTIKIWAGPGEGVTTDITATPVADKIYSWTQPADQTGFTLWVKNDNSEFAFGSSAIGNNNCIKITGSTWNSAAAQWTTYTPGGGGDSTDYTFYVDASSTGWPNVYLRLWNGNSTWNASGTRYLEPTETLSTGVKKFVVKGVTQVGQMMFRSVNSDVNWDAGNESKDISTPVNGTLYTLTTKDTNDRNKWNFKTKPDYQEPAVKPVVTATPASCTFYGSQEVTLSADKEGAKIYYTTNGTEPSAINGTEYSTPLSFTETTTLKAVAILDGVSSEVLTATYTKGTPEVLIQPSSTTFDTTLEVTITATPSGAKIYYTTDGTEPSTAGKSYGSPVKLTISSTTTVKAIAVIEGVQSEKQEGIFTKVKYSGSLYAKGPGFDGNTSWGSFTPLSGSDGVFSFDVNSAAEFAISTSTEDSGIYMPVGIPTDDDSSFPFTVPTGKDNAKEIYRYHVFGKNFKAPAANGKIFIDMNDLKIWYEPKQEALPTALWATGPGASGDWNTTIKLESDGDGLFHFTAPSAGPFVISDTDNLDVFHNTAWGPVEGGENTQIDVPSSMPEVANVEHAQQYGNDFRATGAGVIWFDAKNLKLWSGERILPTFVFEAGKAYYVDASAVAKDGKNWFENADCTLGVEYDGHVHYGGTIVKVSSDPLVYRFTVDEDQTEIVVGRQNNQGFYNTVTVHAPTDASNCIFLDGSTGVLKLDHLGTYSPAGGLYILGQWLGDSWGSNTPIAMDYEPSTGVFSYVVTAAADANSPLYFSISKGSATGKDNSDSFFNAANEFQYESHPYIRFSEPKKANAKNQHVYDHNFAIISAGTVKAKYDETDPTKLKVWYTPADGCWPALYIIGANISDNGKDGQWKTPVQMIPSTTQPGIYSYVLDKLYCDLDYIPSGADVYGITQNEKGHFNISFFPNYSSGDQHTDLNAFWKNSFIPDGGGMGMLSRDGVPFPFGFREEDAERTNWTSTNFVFNEKCTIYVDAVRQLVWVKVKTELSSNQVVFDFWDKGGSKYTEAEGYRWWNNKDNYFAQAYLRDAEGHETDTYPLNFVATKSQKSDLNSSGPEQIFEEGNPDRVNVGQRYHFIASLPASYYQENGKVVEGKHIWIRIKKGASGDVSLERPYAYQATYTQGPKEDIAYNHYGNIKAAGDPIVTIEPSVHMIYADVEAPEHLGNFRESHIMHYPYVNQYSTAVTVNDGNVYPFWVEGLTEPAKNESGETIADQYVPVDGARVVFEKSNQVTVSYGSIRETKYGTTGMAVIKGIDHANAADDDKMEVTVTYTSPGLIFARTKTEPLKIDANELPTMQTSQDTPLDVAAFYSGTACNQGLTVDLILHQKFEFRDIMTQGRAAYIGYEVKIDNPNDHSHVAEGHEHMAKNGVPLMWDFKDDHNRDIKGFTDLDKWHYEAFTGKSMAIQLHHVLCGETKADLEGKTVTGSVTFHLYVPVATEFAFETGTTSLVRGMHKAGEQVNSSVQGDPNHPYTGSVSAKSYDTLKHNIDFSFAGNITTGVEGVGVEDAPVEFYNLQGVRMTSETLAPGIYIRRQGNETSKVYIR